MSKTNKSLFHGFPQETFHFLADLSRNNNKQWFEANRPLYNHVVVEPALLFVKTLGAELKKLVPSVIAEPKIGGSLFRIHRDTRFSADKRPYKTHVGIRFRDKDTTASSKCSGPLFYVEFDARDLRLGVGSKAFESRMLAAYRQSVIRKETQQILDSMLQLAESEQHEIIGEQLKRPPRGFAECNDIGLIKRKGIFIRGEEPIPKRIHQPAFVKYCLQWFVSYAPLFQALREISTTKR